MANSNSNGKWQTVDGNGSGKWQWHGRICVANKGLDVHMAGGQKAKWQWQLQTQKAAENGAGKGKWQQ